MVRDVMPSYEQLIEDIGDYRSEGFEDFSRSINDAFKPDWPGAKWYKAYVIQISDKLGDRFDELRGEKLHLAIDRLVLGSKYDGLKLVLAQTEIEIVSGVLGKAAQASAGM